MAAKDQQRPKISGGLAKDTGALPTYGTDEAAPLIFDKTSGALITTTASGGTTMVQGISASGSGNPNPIVIAGVGFNGDSTTQISIRATFSNGDSLGTLAVNLDPSLVNTVVVSGTTTVQKLGNPGVTGDKATATAGTATITYAAGSGSVCNFITSVHQSYSGSATLPTALAPGNLQIKDGATVLADIDITAAGANNFYFDPPIQGTAATAMTVVLTTGGTAVVGKINARHYQQ